MNKKQDVGAMHDRDLLRAIDEHTREEKECVKCGDKFKGKKDICFDCQDEIDWQREAVIVDRRPE
jgi:hypothetical protein